MLWAEFGESRGVFQSHVILTFIKVPDELSEHNIDVLDQVLF